jgi:large subunit ribosomal protein L21e
MTQRTGGLRRKTRNKLRKNVREKGKINLRRYLQKFVVNDKVALVLDPSVHSGIYHPRFHGDVGLVVGKQGSCYKVEVKDGKLIKLFIVHPSHMRKLQ